MGDFFQALQSELAGAPPVLLCALSVGLLVSIACGVVGTFVVTRRITYLAGGIAHCVLGGMGAAVYCRKALGWSLVDPVWGIQWISPLFGAVVAAMLAAAIIGFVSLRFKQREDTVISALWASGMALGVLFISATPGYQQDLVGYLFGDITMVSPANLVPIAALDVAVVIVSLLLYKQFVAICFDEEFARSRGVRVEFHYFTLLALTAMTVVLLVFVVGIVMVIAMLTIPVAIADQFARRMWQVMVLAAGLTMAMTTAGIAISYGPDLPSGPVIIVLSAGLYLIVLLTKTLIARTRRGRRPACQPESPES
ncbi:MAG: metal ABC transporter permease [Phycisphaerae bacterium]|jgi:zinc transport system permease protein|nr:metal ABC transporter permease [Phycisphaerae bacterium]